MMIDIKYRRGDIMRISSPEIDKLREEVRPYLVDGSYGRLKEGTPQKIIDKFNKISDLLDREYKEAQENMSNMAMKHTVHGKVVYQSDNWDEVIQKRLEREKQEKDK